MGKSQYLLAEDTIDESDIADLIEWLKTNPWLTQGSLVTEFESQWASWLGTKHALFVNSGSSANLLMYYALLASGRLKNRKVIVPAVSWATTVAPAIQFGFEPIMCDAEPVSFGMDSNHLEDMLKKHSPAAVIVVHVLGVPCNLDAIVGLQRQYEFILMEDACAATGSKYGETYVGNFGTLSSFSFFFGHHLSTIEGGMVCTNDTELHNLLLQLRSHGWAKDLPRDVEQTQAAACSVDGFNRPFTFYYPGFNLRSSDLNARIGLSQMKKLDDVVRRRVDNHAVYQTTLPASGTFSCQHNEKATICSIAFAAMAQSESHREAVVAKLREQNVETRPLGGGNMSRQPYWRKEHAEVDFPVADDIAARVLQLPTHPAHNADDIRFICETMLSA